VARAEGIDARIATDETDLDPRLEDAWCRAKLPRDDSVLLVWEDYRPSTDWSQGGPLIERHRITIHYVQVGEEPHGWMAALNEDRSYMSNILRYEQRGCPTPLIAAMRALVAAKYGEEVPGE